MRATAGRRAVFWASFAVCAGAVVLSWTVLPGEWIWLVFLVDFVTFTVLANRWANQDALTSLED